MERVSLASEVLRAAGYDAVSHTLEVELATGRLYQYVGVPAVVYHALLRAQAPGTYYHYRIQGRYPRRISTDDAG
jgi:hypothetical protein